MRRHIIKKEITSLLFIIGLFVFAVINFIHTYPYLKEVSFSKITDLTSLQQTINQTESVIDENVYNKYAFVEAYGIWNLILDKNEIDGFAHIKDEDGYLHYSNFWNDESDDIDSLVDTVVQLQEKAEENGTNVVVIVPPVKDNTQQVRYETGMPYSDKSWIAEEYMTKLEEKGIPVLDFKDTIEQSGMTYDEVFYVTDHHWTTEAVFVCYQDFVNKMNGWFNLNLDPDGLYTDINNYNILEYKQSTLGSHGRDTGIGYAGGLEDFTVMYPKYKTNFHYVWNLSGEEQTLDGRFEDTLLSTYNIVNENIYEQDKYASYMNAIATYDKVENKANPDAPKVLFLRDSCTSPFAAFAAQVFSQTDLVWTHKLDNDLEKYVDIKDYDYIVISLYPDSLTENMFRFNLSQE